LSVRFVELSHPIENGTITYPGLPAPVMSDFLSRSDSARMYAAGTTFHIGRVEMIANTGTYVDAPWHRYEGRADVGALPLEKLADVPGLVVDAGAEGRAIGAVRFEGAPVEGRAVLVRTGWARHWGTAAYGEGHPFLTRDAAAWLAREKAALVGIDSLNIDDADDGERPAHTLLLGAGIPILEHLCGLEKLPKSGFRLHAVPAPIHGLGSFPVRAYAILESAAR
jgi:kynurenine formamidase